MIAALLDENNIVINRLVVDDLGVLPNLVDGTGSVIGATYDPDTQTFTPPDPVVEIPQQVSMAAGRVAMYRAGELSGVETYIASLNGEDAIWFNEEKHIRRNHPLVEKVRIEKGWTTDYVDQLFISAKQIEAET